MFRSPRSSKLKRFEFRCCCSRSKLTHCHRRYHIHQHSAWQHTSCISICTCTQLQWFSHTLLFSLCSRNAKKNAMRWILMAVVLLDRRNEECLTVFIAKWFAIKRIRLSRIAPGSVLESTGKYSLEMVLVRFKSNHFLLTRVSFVWHTLWIVYTVHEKRQKNCPSSGPLMGRLIGCASFTSSANRSQSQSQTNQIRTWIWENALRTYLRRITSHQREENILQ